MFPTSFIGVVCNIMGICQVRKSQYAIYRSEKIKTPQKAFTVYKPFSVSFILSLHIATTFRHPFIKSFIKVQVKVYVLFKGITKL